MNNEKSLRLFYAFGKKYFQIYPAILFSLFFLTTACSVSALNNKNIDGDFVISAAGKSVPLYASSKDYPGVLRVLKLFQGDIKNVSGVEPVISLDETPNADEIIVVGTIGNSLVIDKLIKENKINVSDVTGKWDSYCRQVVENPFPGVSRALVIAGSNKRGTIYGMFDISKQIGVSPLYWWDDVPIKKHSTISISSSRFVQGEPKVKYRGIFINDEAPALSGWAFEKFGGFNSKFYDHVFELILRMRGNFLWPAMWGRMFYVEDPINPKLADEYGIVISTSHHEPMMRAHQEWAQFGKGPWNYEKNDSVLREFWREGIKRMNGYESVITLAMRGDGDEAMSPDANVSLLQKIVEDQRKIIADVTKKDVTTIPQVWALYKEVQEYYDKGMRVPDDVTLLLCDDNWGNVRKLPKLGDKPRKGGYGMYYHFDYVGGPRNYKWLNVTQIERVWEQMHLSYEYGVDRIWIVNVGDIKPMEFPIQFFLDYAWDPEKIPAEKLPQYVENWASEQFGEKYAKEIAGVMNLYTKYNSRRKPEMLSPETYSLINFREAETVVNDYNSLEEKAEKIYNEIPEEYKDAFYQLVLHPVQACANLNELYVTTAKNRLYAKQGRAATNDLAENIKKLFERDADITNYYNKVLAGGKWNHFMDQTHIGYTNWQQPDSNSMPEVKFINIPDDASMGVAIEGSDKFWPGESSKAMLPVFDPYNQQKYYVEIFNRGNNSFECTIKTDAPWVTLNNNKIKIDKQERIFIGVDWTKAPKGINNATIKISGPDNVIVDVDLQINNFEIPKADQNKMFVESNNYVSVNAENYTSLINSNSVKWLMIPNLGRTSSAMTIMPVTVGSQTPGGAGARLEYKMFFTDEGEYNINIYLSPLLNFGYKDGFRFAVSIDDAEPQLINANEGEIIPDWKYPAWWNIQVGNNIKICTTKTIIKNPGVHILKFWAVDPAVVLQKIVVEKGAGKKSYLGAPQCFRFN